MFEIHPQRLVRFRYLAPGANDIQLITPLRTGSLASIHGLALVSATVCMTGRRLCIATGDFDVDLVKRSAADPGL